MQTRRHRAKAQRRCESKIAKFLIPTPPFFSGPLFSEPHAGAGPARVPGHRPTRQNKIINQDSPLERLASSKHDRIHHQFADRAADFGSAVSSWTLPASDSHLQCCASISAKRCSQEINRQHKNILTCSHALVSNIFEPESLQLDGDRFQQMPSQLASADSVRCGVEATVFDVLAPEIHRTMPTDVLACRFHVVGTRPTSKQHVLDPHSITNVDRRFVLFLRYHLGARRNQQIMFGARSGCMKSSLLTSYILAMASFQTSTQAVT